MTQFGNMFGNTTANKINAQQAGGDANMVTDDDVGRDQSLNHGLSEAQLEALLQTAWKAAQKGNQQEVRQSFSEVVGDKAADWFMKFFIGLGTKFFMG